MRYVKILTDSHVFDAVTREAFDKEKILSAFNPLKTGC